MAKKGNLCSDNQTFTAQESLAWSMLAAKDHDSFCDGQGYAQVGYTHRRRSNQTSVFRFFWEWVRTDCTGVSALWTDPGSGGPNAGTQYRFTSERDGASPNHVKLSINDGNIPIPCNVQGFCGETGYDPLNYWHDPIQSQFFEEVFSYDLDFPGEVGNTVLWSAVQEKLATGWTSLAFRQCTPTCGPAPGWIWADKYHIESSLCFANQGVVDNNTAWTAWSDPLIHYSGLCQ